MPNSDLDKLAALNDHVPQLIPPERASLQQLRTLIDKSLPTEMTPPPKS